MLEEVFTERLRRATTKTKYFNIHCTLLRDLCSLLLWLLVFPHASKIIAIGNTKHDIRDIFVVS